MNWLEFQLMIISMIENEKIETTEELERFSEDLHGNIEMALSDYASDIGIDYTPYC